MESRYTIRETRKNDAKQIYDLVKKKVLDLNSHYLYLLQTTHFKNSCSVALFEKPDCWFCFRILFSKMKMTHFLFGK